MAQLTVVPTLGLVFPHCGTTRVRSYKAAVALTAGQGVALSTAGQAILADASVVGAQQFRGVVLSTVAAGDAVSVCEQGEIYGFALTTVAYDGLVYLDTSGALADAANGTKTVPVGRVKALTDLGTLTKVLYVQSQILSNW